MIITNAIIIALIIFYKKEASTTLGCIAVQNQINNLIEKEKKLSQKGTRHENTITLHHELKKQLKANKELNCGFSEKSITEMFD